MGSDSKVFAGVAPWGFMPPFLRAEMHRQMNWQHYLKAAEEWGYSEREARLVAAGVMQVAKQIPQAIDVLAEARAVLASAKFD